MKYYHEQPYSVEQELEIFKRIAELEVLMEERPCLILTEEEPKYKVNTEECTMDQVNAALMAHHRKRMTWMERMLSQDVILEGEEEEQKTFLESIEKEILSYPMENDRKKRVKYVEEREVLPVTMIST
jgi:hypothetical protein